MDPTTVGATTAELMEQLDEIYGMDTTAEVQEVLVVVTVKTFKLDQDLPDEEEEELRRLIDNDEIQGFTNIHFRFSDPVWTHQLGLISALIEAHHAMRQRGRFAG